MKKTTYFGLKIYEDKTDKKYLENYLQMQKIYLKRIINLKNGAYDNDKYIDSYLFIFSRKS